MSTLQRGQSTKLFVLLLGLLLLPGTVACTSGQRTAVAQAAQTISSEVDETLEKPSELVFAGQIANEAGAWQNEYVVVLFKNGEELTRTTSRLLNSPLSGKGPVDGVFELRIPNIYELTLNHGFYDSANNLLPMSPVPGLVGTRYIGRWLGELTPNDIRTFSVRDKQLTYSVVVLPVPLAELTEAYQRGNLWLHGKTLITDQANAPATGELVVEATPAPQPTSLSQTSVQLILLPSHNNGQDWRLQLTGYYGNRWDVWERFVAGKGHSMSWETFKEAVLVYNAHLESDGYVFYPDKVYRLPTRP